jgi:hypothetical protein
MTVKTRKPAPDLTALTKEQQRVAIAKDVLRTIRFYRHVGGCGYWSLPTDIAISIPKNTSLQDHLPKPKDCGVCALGAAMLSYVKLFNKVKTDVLFNEHGVVVVESDTTINVLKRCFSRTQLVDIEAAFEQRANPISMTGAMHDKELFREKAEAFGRRYPDSRKRLRAIMLNIVKNSGTFVP